MTARVTYEQALKDISLVFRCPRYLRLAASHITFARSWTFMLSPSFPCFPLLIFEQKRDCLQFTYEFASTRVWQATLESEELGKKEEVDQMPD